MNNETPKNITPLGLALHNARLAASLSIEEVAERLNLGGGAVRDLEGDITVLIESNKYSPVYLRGYLANYAKLVDLKAISEFVEYQQLENFQKPENNFRATASTGPVKKKKLISLPFVMMLMFIAVVVVIANQLGFLSADKSASIEAEKTSENNLNEENKPFNPLLINKETAIESENNASIPAVKKTEMVEGADKVDTTTQITSAETKSITVTEALTEANNEKIKTDAADVINNAQPAQQKKVINESLTLTFAKDCWTEIVDATGKRLAFDLYKAGAVLSIEGVTPFKLKLGVPSAVAINYQGKTLETFTAGHTAEFYVPE